MALRIDPAADVRAPPPFEHGYVEADWLVMPGELGVKSRVGDDVWDLSSADHHDGRETASLKIDFTYIPPTMSAWRLALKEFAYHRLNTRLSPTVKTLSAYTCSREQMRLKRFVRWLQAFHPQVSEPAYLTQQVVHAYRVWLEQHGADMGLAGVSGGNHRKSGRIDPSTVWSYLSPLKAMDLYRDYLRFPLPFSPYEGRLTAGLVGFSTTGQTNATPVVPDEVLHPVVTWAKRYVEFYAADIEAILSDAKRFWDDPDASYERFAWNVDISRCPETDKPWRAPLVRRPRDPRKTAYGEMSNLIAACAIIVLYLSGIRPGELLTLRRACLKAVREPTTGREVKWTLTGLALKKRGRKRRNIATWVIPEIAATAVRTLQRVFANAAELRGADNLILNLPALFPSGAKTNYSLSERSLGEFIDGFIETIRDRHDADMPEYSLMPSQFRRTLARHIARQPFGIIAGKLQYHHVKATVFEGYAGTYDDGFRLDVAEEELLAHIDLLAEIQEEAEEGHLAGPGAHRLAREIKGVRAEIAALVDGSPNEMVLSAGLRSLAKQLHVGVLNYCLFDPVKALCLTEDQKRKRAPEPSLNNCAPDRCGNSSIGSCHVSRWVEIMEDAKDLQGLAKSRPQIASLGIQIQRYDRIIKSVSGDTSGV